MESFPHLMRAYMCFRKDFLFSIYIQRVLNLLARVFSIIERLFCSDVFITFICRRDFTRVYNSVISRVLMAEEFFFLDL